MNIEQATTAEERPDIDYALVEEKRPPMYTAMKYWGKKPHNIWSQFIDRYCPPGGVVLDPFAGSAMSAFEAAKLGRRAIAFDLNPLTSFMVEVLAAPYDEAKFLAAFHSVEAAVAADPVYTDHYLRERSGESAVVYNYRWDGGVVAKVALVTAGGERRLVPADPADRQQAAEMRELRPPFWYPTDKFPDTPPITHKFISDVGGDSFQHLWTRRNLYLLSRMLHEIESHSDHTVRTQLLFGFIQTLHLTCKMVVPRSSASNRDFSGSWGRADYMIRRRSMEQNPLVVFRRSCVEKQGVVSALRDARASFPRRPSVADVVKRKGLKQGADINYGTVDVADLPRYVAAKSVDFVITDPPYAGLVFYLDLSLVWLVWLQHVNPKYTPDLSSEITVKKGRVGREEYKRRLTNAFRQIHQVLKDDGKLVVTFHHKKLQEWNDFVWAVKLAGFTFEKVTHQYNRRSGESNVANPYGTSGADFYIRCAKHSGVDFGDEGSNLEHFIVQKTIEIIALRAEPTPYTFIIGGLVPAMLQAGFVRPKEYKAEIERVLARVAGPGQIFVRQPNRDNKAGDYWWFAQPSQHINYPDCPLSDRVDETVLSLLRRRVSVRLDDVLAELFRTYPNGLTPDPKGIRAVLEKYAFRSAERWKIKETAVVSASAHTRILRDIADIGHACGYRVFVGKREQWEVCSDGLQLGAVADIRTLISLGAQYNVERLARVEMIDILWLGGSQDTVECVFEVEQSTGFTSALQRASNLAPSLPKFMIIPERREDELLSIRDPLFTESFRANNWRYATDAAIARLRHSRRPTLGGITQVSKELP